MTKIISRAVTAISRSKYAASNSSSKSGGVGASTLVESVGGSSVDILKTTSSVAESDSNVYSALRAIKEITTRAVSKLNDDTVAGNISFLKDINVAGAVNVAGVLTASEIDATEMKGTNGTFANLLKAAAVTITGLATLGSVEATTLHATSGTIDTLRSTVGAIDTLNATNGNINILNGATAFFTNYVKSPIGNFTNLGAGYLPYHTSNGLVNSSIQTDGTKVGIGATPSFGLDVNGTFRATSDMFADGNIGTRNYVSQTAGWRVGANGLAEFRKMYADELDVQAFTAQVSQALAGSDFLTKSVSKLSYNFVIPSSVGGSSQLIVDDLEGFPATQCFANGDYIRLRPINKSAGLVIGNAYGTIVLDTTYGTNGFLNGTQAYTFTVTSLSNASGITVFKGSEVLDYGTSGSGLIKRTTLDSAGSPYMDIDTWVTDPSISTNYTVHARLGNLSGIANCSGYGLYSNKAFLTESILVGDLTKAGNYMEYAGNALNIHANLYVTGGNAATNDSVNTAINNVQIGGTNLFSGTKDLGGLGTHGTYTNNDYLGFTSVSYNDWTSYFDICYQNAAINFNINQYYTLSFYAKSTVEGDTILSYFYPNLNDQIGDGHTPTNLTTEWKRYSITWYRQYSDAVAVIVARMYPGHGSGTVSVCGVKLEEGTKATSWSLAPSETPTETAIKAAFSLSGDNISLFGKTINISGAAVFSSLATNDSVSTAISNIQVGGTNLLSYTSDLSTWVKDNSEYGVIGTVEKQEDGSVLITDNTSNTRLIYYGTGPANSVPAYPNTKYTVSIKFKKQSGTPTFRWQLQEYQNDTHISTTWTQDLAGHVKDIDGWQTVYATIETSSITTGLVLLFQDGEDYTPYVHSFYLKEPKLEIGIKATDWSPSPDDFAISIGYSSYADMVAKAAANQTIINGGYIRTSLIEAGAIVADKIAAGAITADKIAAQVITTAKLSADLFDGNYINANYINAATILTNALTAGTIVAGNATITNLTVDSGKFTNATVTGNITATTGKIGAFTLNADGTLKSSYYQTTMTLLASGMEMESVSSPQRVKLWETCLNVESDYQLIGPAYISCTQTDYPNKGNVALMLEAAGSTSGDSDSTGYGGNHAIFIQHGYISGFNLHIRRITASQTLSKYDNIIICKNTSDINVTLPSVAGDGHLYKIKNAGTASIYVLTQSGAVINSGKTNRITSWGSIPDGRIMEFWYDKVNLVWEAGYSQWD